MAIEQESNDLRPLLDGLQTDAASYFESAERALEGVEITCGWAGIERDEYWEKLPEALRAEAKRLDDRLISLMGQITRAVRRALLSSEADQRDITTATKAMRAALILRRFRSWNTEILNDEDVVLGVKPAGQSDDEGFAPVEAAATFADWAKKIGATLDLVAASADLGAVGERQLKDDVRYRPGTAFLMMWMDNPNLSLVTFQMQ